MTDLAGSLWANRTLTSHLRNHHGNLAGTGAGTGNEIQKLSRLRRVLLYLRARFRIHVELPVRFQALGWEKRSLSGSSPVLHGQEPRRCRSFAGAQPPSPTKKPPFPCVKPGFRNLFGFII
jgi:hypothetical protein